MSDKTTIRPAAQWRVDGQYSDIRYELSDDGIAKITINRPEARNAFRPQTLFQLSEALNRAQNDPDVGVIILTGEGDMAFCSGGDQRIRGDDGYIGDDEMALKGIGRLNVLDLQIQMRRCPKPIVAMIAGFAIGGGHILHICCDLSIAADNARFGQTGPRVGSFDGGFGSGLLARQIGQKRAKEIWFLCRQYDAQTALNWGLVNSVVALEALEEETVQWCREMLELSPMALRMLKASFNAADDGLAGVQQLAGDATLLFYMSEEAQEGRDAYVEKRKPDFFEVSQAALAQVTAERTQKNPGSFSSLQIWLIAARPRTLPAAVAPVLVGTSLAWTVGPLDWVAFAAASLGALFIQVGTNLSNDYSDARRGADTDERLGPVRVTAGGLVPPKQVLFATYASFAIAVLVGIYLIIIAGPVLLLIGAASILAGVLYTGGPRPYGYEGFGELFVFTFFGIVAVTGSYFVQRQALEWEAFVLAIPVGLLASAILVVNNVRDIETDRRAGKKTLAVRLGRVNTRKLFATMILLSYPTALLPSIVGSFNAWPALIVLTLPLAAGLVRTINSHTDGPTLNSALARAGILELGFCLLLTIGLLLNLQ